MKLFFESRHSIPDNALIKTKSLNGISIITDTIVPPKYYKKYLNQVHNLYGLPIRIMYRKGNNPYIG